MVSSHPSEATGYFARSGLLSTSLLFILPLLLFYEVGLLTIDPSARSAAADILKGPLFILGRHATLVFNLLVAILFVAAFIKLRAKGGVKPLIFVPMLFESVIYAAALGPVVWFILRGRFDLPRPVLNRPDLLAKCVTAAGAGVYEEILFRGVLLGSLYYVGTRVMELKPLLAGTASLIIAAAIFSLMHFVTGGEPVEGERFLFRLTAALILSGVYLARGLGIACWTHALYNVLALTAE